MRDGEDWIMRPVEMGYCKYESLVDGTLNLMDVRRMNSSIDVKLENQARARKAQED